LKSKVKNLKRINYINGDAPDLTEEVGRLGGLLNRATIDVAFVGVGENGHLAFNDPPADFEPRLPTWSLPWIKPVDGNNWAKAGSRR